MSTAGVPLDDVNNFALLELGLVELLKQAVAGMTPAVQILTSAELADVKERSQHTPAVHLIYGGYRVVEKSGLNWKLAHTWHAVTAVRNVAGIKSGQAARQEAGPLVARVMAALAGASLKGAVLPLDLVTPLAARYSGGFQYIPSAVVATTVFRKPV